MIDDTLVRAFNVGQKTVLLADLGTAARDSMVYWATHDSLGRRELGVYVGPKSLHHHIGRNLNSMKVNGEAPFMHLIDSQRLRLGVQPAPRIAIETSTYGTKLKSYLEVIAKKPDVSIVLRLVYVPQRSEAIKHLRAQGFRVMVYSYTPDVCNNMMTSIRYLDGLQINAK